jgi:hypothetical protein
MADSRSIMQEFRFLEQKRQAGSLTQAESARHVELRDLVGFEQPLPARGGFDVTAAAAQLRESLLPAGLRSRPVDSPAPPPPTPAWTAPVAPPTPPPEVAADAFFDPSSLDQDPSSLDQDPSSLDQEVRPQAWNPEAPGYDPDAPYDEAAWIAAGYDPTATYDWSAQGGADPSALPEPAAAVEPAGEEVLEEAILEVTEGEPPLLEFGEYDGPGAPISLGAPEEPLPPAPAAPAPVFGDYDAPPPAALSAIGEPSYGGPEGDSLPGGAPLELGEAPADWAPEGALDAGFELASDGSFGEPAPPPQVAPWSGPEQAAPADLWASAPALDLNTPFAPIPVTSSGLASPPLEAALERLEPEETLEQILEAPIELIPEPEPDPEPAFEALPAEPEHAPRSLADLDSAVEIDVPPEISAAYDLVPVAPPPLDFGAPPPAARTAPAPAPAPLAKAAAPVEPEPEIRPAPSGGFAVVAGLHRVTVHTLDGRVLRGTLTDSDLEAAELKLDTGTPGQATALPTADVKAIFFMLAPGEVPPPAQGKRVRVAFRDGRQVAGISADYQEGGLGFFMIPVDTRTNTERIWVYQAAVKQVTVS